MGAKGKAQTSPPKCLGPCPLPEGRARRSEWPGQRESRPAAEVPERQASAIFLKHEAPSWVQIAGLPRGPSQGLYSVTPRHGQTPSPGLLLSAELCWLWKSAPPPLTGGPGWATGSRGQGGQRAGLHLRTHRDSGVPSVRADGGARRSSRRRQLRGASSANGPTNGTYVRGRGGGTCGQKRILLSSCVFTQKAAQDVKMRT